MEHKPDGGAAFPLQHAVADANDSSFKMGQPGMSLRDYFAAQALAGMAASSFFHGWTRGWKTGSHASDGEGAAAAARIAYDMADAMLKAREA